CSLRGYSYKNILTCFNLFPGLWWHPAVVGKSTKLHISLILLGVHRISSGGRFGHSKVGHQACVWLRPTGDCPLQPVHSLGERDPLWNRDSPTVHPRVCFVEHYKYFINSHPPQPPKPRPKHKRRKYDYLSNGLLSGAPFICSYVASVLFCYIADKLVTNNYMSLTNVRKVMTALSQIVPGILVLLISYLGCDINLVLVVWFLAVTLITASYAGAMANVVDIAPNFAGPVLAFAQTIHMTASFLSPLATFAMLDEQEHLMSSWRMVFYVTAFVAISTYIVYQIWGTGDIQPWNYANGPVNAPEQEELMIDKPHKNGITLIKDRANEDNVA
ncbi:hypothetical protein NQ314_003164, partial [Rhamnusium bicolor]